MGRVLVCVAVVVFSLAGWNVSGVAWADDGDLTGEVMCALDTAPALHMKGVASMPYEVVSPLSVPGVSLDLPSATGYGLRAAQ